jgi:tRNA pseudouridine55 synthase
MNWDGLLLVNKPEGETSHTIVQNVKARLRVAKAGHLGTLDPLATGVFPVCLGKSTRLAPFYMGAEKCYIAAVRFGFFTSTDDREGAPEGPRKTVKLKREHVEKVVESFKGEYQQRPPSYSAKKIQGKKAYELARKGVKPDLPLQKVIIHDARLLDFEKDRAVIFIHCGSGTYIRSIARDLGTRLECGAHVQDLTRTRFNDFSVEQTCAPDAEMEKLQSAFIPLEQMLSYLPEIIIDSSLSKKVLSGSAIEAEEPVENEWVRIFDKKKTLLAIAHVESFETGQRFQPKIVFAG